MEAARGGKLVILALMLFLTVSVVSGVVCSQLSVQLSVQPVFAEPPDPCFGDGCEGTDCSDIFSGTSVHCCWTGPNGNIICQVCWINPEGGFGYCDPPRTKDSSTIAPPPSGVAPPPPPGPGKGGPGKKTRR